MIALLLVLAPPQTAPACSLAMPAVCRDTNQLAWSPGFATAIRSFLGERRADFLYPGHRVADQAIDVLGGPPDEPARIGPYWRFTACRARSCEEKGALVATPAGVIVAIAIIHSACAVTAAPNDCFAHQTLTIYTRHAGPDVVRDLRGWATTAVTGEPAVAGLRPSTLDRVEVVPV